MPHDVRGHSLRRRQAGWVGVGLPFWVDTPIRMGSLTSHPHGTPEFKLIKRLIIMQCANSSLQRGTAHAGAPRTVAKKSARLRVFRARNAARKSPASHGHHTRVPFAQRTNGPARFSVRMAISIRSCAVGIRVGLHPAASPTHARHARESELELHVLHHVRSPARRHQPTLRHSPHCALRSTDRSAPQKVLTQGLLRPSEGCKFRPGPLWRWRRAC